METFLIVFQIVLAILIILIVLINVTKGSEYGAVFRGAEAIFGGAGPTNFLNKVTMILVLLFFLNSILLTKIFTEKHKPSILKTNIPASSASKETLPPVSSPSIPVPPKEPLSIPENTTQK
ncbi:MAG: preprotein translocase subunit SecG [Thermodesulfobacteriota bacterium]|nr:MAG: preprotein translocase subunit SecG [Thermodesulfobacteriota bacterium]